MQTPKLLFIPFILICLTASAQIDSHSIARQWNEIMLQTIREDFARPPVQARNLFHTSVAMYDGWAVYDDEAETYLLGKTVGQFSCPFKGIPKPKDIEAARRETISYAMYRMLTARFSTSPKAVGAHIRFRNKMKELGYDPTNRNIDYENGSPSALGNYIGECIIGLGFQDGSNEQKNYMIQYYEPVNPPMPIVRPGDSALVDPNRWQPLKLPEAFDQNGHPIPGIQKFQSPEWGLVYPFALKTSDMKTYTRDGRKYNVYLDPGPMPMLDTVNGGGSSDHYKWNFILVPAWGAHLDPSDSVMWDISPASIGNVQHYPTNLDELRTFYNFDTGKDPGAGYSVNPYTGKPYEPQIVPRGDYARVLTQFWADGPKSETPPGHWYAILNYVNDKPELVKKFNGKGEILDDLEWDVKAYFALGGALHDAAITAWGIKGWYDGVRPITAVRYMSDLGQSSNKKLPRYHPAGIPLVPGKIEMVKKGDPLAGAKGENINKIKLYTWRGPLTVKDTATQTAGVGWILAENWWPFQLKTFVTPPFAGYVSGHSTYSRAGAEALTLITGDPYFPGGLGEFYVKANSNFLRVEKGPSVDITLQWAAYRDASDQCSLSRIWGGIHPPFDDIPGRLAGAKIGIEAFGLAKSYFYKDKDRDGFYSYEDCDDNNASIYPGAENPELDCNKREKE